jgi:hypothetical protein
MRARDNVYIGRIRKGENADGRLMTESPFASSPPRDRFGLRAAEATARVHVRCCGLLAQNRRSAFSPLRSRLICARLSRSIDDRRSFEADTASTVPAGQHGGKPSLAGAASMELDAPAISNWGTRGTSFDHLVGASEERLRYGQAKGLGNLGVVGAESRRVAKTSNPMEIKGRY